MKYLVTWLEDETIRTEIVEQDRGKLKLNLPNGTCVSIQPLLETITLEQWLSGTSQLRVVTNKQVQLGDVTDPSLTTIIQQRVPQANEYIRSYNKKVTDAVIDSMNDCTLTLTIGHLVQRHQISVSTRDHKLRLESYDNPYLFEQLGFVSHCLISTVYQSREFNVHCRVNMDGKGVIFHPTKLSYNRESPLETHVIDESATLQDLLSSMEKTLKFWFIALRSHQYLITLLSVLLGVILLDTNQPDLFRLMAIVVGTFCIQSGGNLLNDYFDYRSQLDELSIRVPTSLWSKKFLREKLIHPEFALTTGLSLFFVGVISGLYLNMIVPGNLILILGVFGALTTYFYTGEPLKLAYRGVGEVLLALNFGPLIIFGTYLVLTDTTLPLSDYWFLFSPLLFVTAIFILNNLGDIEVDRLVNKKTSAVRLGHQGSRVLVAALLLITIFPLILYGFDPLHLILQFGVTVVSIFFVFNKSIQTGLISIIGSYVVYVFSVFLS